MLAAVIGGGLFLCGREVLLAIDAAFGEPETFCHTTLSPQTIPLELGVAVLAQEDSDFFAHSGVHLGEALDSLIANVRARRIVRGASTIDMQVAALCYPYSQRSSRWYAKFREALLAVLLSMRYAKADILAMYLSAAPLGDGPETVGFISAGAYYFQKPPREWTEREIWSLVTALRNRHTLSPAATRNLHLLTPSARRELSRARAREERFRDWLRHELEAISWIAAR